MDYDYAVKAILRSTSEQLPFVLDVLKQAGFEFSDANLAKLMSNTKRRAEAAAVKRRKRKLSWEDTDDEIANILRTAYLNGACFSTIAKLSGMHRSQLYEYMNCTRVAPKYSHLKIKMAVKSVMEDELGEE